jgi:hypothetical protein
VHRWVGGVKEKDCVSDVYVCMWLVIYIADELICGGRASIRERCVLAVQTATWDAGIAEGVLPCC